jgi:hypothetical protein
MIVDFASVNTASGSNNLDEQIFSLIGGCEEPAFKFNQWCQTFFTASTLHEFTNLWHKNLD